MSGAKPKNLHSNKLPDYADTTDQCRCIMNFPKAQWLKTTTILLYINIVVEKFGQILAR